MHRSREQTKGAPRNPPSTTLWLCASSLAREVHAAPSVTIAAATAIFATTSGMALSMSLAAPKADRSKQRPERGVEGARCAAIAPCARQCAPVEERGLDGGDACLAVGAVRDAPRCVARECCEAHVPRGRIDRTLHAHRCAVLGE